MLSYDHPISSRIIRRDAGLGEITVQDGLGRETVYDRYGKPKLTAYGRNRQCRLRGEGEVVRVIEMLMDRTCIVYGSVNDPIEIITPDSVRASVADMGIDVVKDQGGIRQIWSKADGLLDFTEPSTNSVLVSWYPPSGAPGQKDMATGNYLFSGSPVKTFLFTRTVQAGYRLVSGPGCTACASGKVIYHIRACDSVYEATGEESTCLLLEERRGTEFLFRYEWKYLPSNGAWTLVRGEGADAVIDSLVRPPDIYPGRILETRTTATGDGRPASVTKELYSYDYLGYRLLKKSAVMPDGQEKVLYAAARIDQGVNAGRFSAVTNAYGGAESYAYDSDGRMIRKTETVHGGIVQVTTNTYASARDVNGFVDRRPLRTIVTQDGITVSDTTYSNKEPFDYFYNIHSIQSIPFVDSETRTDPKTGARLKSYRYYYPLYLSNSLERGRIKYILNHDGSATHYTYAAGEDGSWTNTVTQGYWLPPSDDPDFLPTDTQQSVRFNVLLGKSTQTVSTHDFRGDVVRTDSYVHTGSEFTLAGSETHTYNIMHKRLGTERHDGTSEMSNWICTGPVWQRNADGTSVTNTFDTAKRVKTSTRYTPFGNLKTTYNYDADGRVVYQSVATNGINTAIASSTVFDTQGREILSVDAMGRTNRTSYSLDSRTVTHTDPAGAVVVENYATDGSLLSRTGTVMRAEYYTQGVDAATGTRWEKTTYGSPTGAEYTKSYYNALGQLVLQERPGIGSTTLKTVYAYNAKGQLESETRLVQGGTGTYDLPVTTYAYNQFGDLSATTQTAANVSRIQSSDSAFTLEGIFVRQVSSSIQSCSDVTIPAMTNAVITRLYPLTNGLLSVLFETCQRDVRGNETVQTVVQNPATYVLTTTVSNATSVLPAITLSLAGLTLSSTDQHGCTTIYGYDALMRQISAETRSGASNERLTGAYTHYNIIGQVDYIEDALSTRTVYGYEPGTGRRVSTTQHGQGSDPALATYEAFDAASRTIATWGATYPVAYEYDTAGRMIAMYTYRGTAAMTSSSDIAALKPQMDRTQWLYDQATGLLTNKVYADGKGPSYSYTSLGQLSTRIWARPSSTGQQLLTRYAYDSFGSLTNTTYSDGTHSIAFTYNALGQMKTATDASGTRTIDYAADGQMLAEALAFNTSLFTLHEKYDTRGRNQGYALSNEVELITGTMQGFNIYGRLNQVAVDGISGAFTYGYLEGSHLQKTLAMPDGVTRTFGYEANRDLLTMIVHSNATERLVQRDFTFDGLARLANRTLFRANETPATPDAFGYNLRSELTNAVIGANAFAYNFDPIGNRNFALEFGTNTDYTASALNQYTSINPVNPVENFNPDFDSDGNQTLLRTTTGIWHVTYNAENRPILFSNDTTKVEMAYDYMGRRFEYKETVSGTLTRHERYLYRGYLQIASLDMLNNASVKHSISWDPTEPTATRPLALQVGVNTYFYSFDQVKNVTELFDGAGAIAATYDYSPFGHVTSFQLTQSGNNALTQFSNPLAFSSEVSDFSLGLQYYNYRHLNMLDGRWVNRDLIQERGGLNLYGFVGNRSMRKNDKRGLANNLAENEVSQASCKVPTKEISLAYDIRFKSFSFMPSKDKWMEVLTEVTAELVVAGRNIEGELDDCSVAKRSWGVIWDPQIDGKARVPDGVSCRKKFVCRATCETDCCPDKEKKLYEIYMPGIISSHWRPKGYTPETQCYMDPDAPVASLWDKGTCVVDKKQEEKLKNNCEKKAKEACKGKETHTKVVMDTPLQ
jgi:RHS repeat-associated protein